MKPALVLLPGMDGTGELFAPLLPLLEPDFACTVEVRLRPGLGVLARLSLLGHFLANHVDEEAHGFAADITRKIQRTPDAL